MSAEEELIRLRARVSELEERVDHLYRHLGIAIDGDANQVDPRIVELVQRGNLIEAIKIYRELYHVGLAEAKLAVEGLQR
jgi:ribosomal protein L7/L12